MSANRPFTTLDPEAIKKASPKVYKNVINWLSKASTEGNFLTEEMVKAFLYGNPRFLYDYFDDMGIVLSTMFNKENTQWTCIDSQGINIGVIGKTRKEAEEDAFNNIIKFLENNLS
jgi:hypothetical protein